MTLRFHSAIVFLLLAGIANSMGQERTGTRVGSPLPITYEAIPLFSDDSTGALVNLHYRIGQRFFVFVRNTKAGATDEYIARGELMIELRNGQDVSVAREIRTIHLTRPSLPDEREQLPDITGSASFSLSGGEYTIIFSIDDKESGRSFLERQQKVTTRKALPGTFDVAYPMFASVQQSTADGNQLLILPFNRGSSVLFGGSGGYVLQVYRPMESPLSVQWNITEQRSPHQPAQGSFSGSQYTLYNGLLHLDQTDASVRYQMAPASSQGWNILYIPLPLERLEQGRYTAEVTITSGESKHVRTYHFEVIWPTKPLSLNSPQIALEALRHIASEEEMDLILTGNLERNINALGKYWKKRDPDSTTAFNEVMVEYYRRVDEALIRYSTASGGDGYKTDRGRIYILYGQPSRSDRLIPPGGFPTEVWTYERVKRRFIFGDRNKTGNFTLIALENL